MRSAGSSATSRRSSRRSIRASRGSCSASSRAPSSTSSRRRGRRCCARPFCPASSTARIDGNGAARTFPTSTSRNRCACCSISKPRRRKSSRRRSRASTSPAERHAAVLPLVQSRVDAKHGPTGPDAGLDAHARKLTRIDREKARSFAEFVGLRSGARSGNASRRSTASATRLAPATSSIVQLECLLRLVRLEPNPEQVQRFVDRVDAPARSARRRTALGQELAGWLSRCATLSATLPRIAARRRRSHRRATSPGSARSYRAARLVELAGRDADGRAAAGAIIEALGPGAGPALLDAVPLAGRRCRKTAAPPSSCCAITRALVAPALVAALDAPATPMRLQRAIARVLGFAGHGYEVPLGKLLDSARRTDRARSAAQPGADRYRRARRRSSARRSCKNRGWVGTRRRRDALALSRGPKPTGRFAICWRRREFVLRQPQVAGRLLDRAAQNGAANLAPILQTLVPLRYRFWNPGARPRRAAGAGRCWPMMTTPTSQTRARSSKTPEAAEPHRVDPVALLKGLVSLRRLTGLYPAGHPAIEQKLAELDDSVQRHIRAAAALRIDVIHGDGAPRRRAVPAGQRRAGADPARADRSRHRQHPFRRRRDARGAAGAVGVPLAARRRRPTGEPIDAQLAARQIQHISLGRLVPLDTRWKTVQWPDAPSGHARSVLRAVARAHRADVRRRDDGQGHRPRHHPRHRPPADSEGRRQQRRARTDSRGQAVREPHLLPLGQRRDAQPADRQAARVRSGGDGRAGRSGAAARHRQDADPARDPEEAERARQARAADDGGAHDATARRSSSKSTACGR